MHIWLISERKASLLVEERERWNGNNNRRDPNARILPRVEVAPLADADVDVDTAACGRQAPAGLGAKCTSSSTVVNLFITLNTYSSC